MRYVIEHETVLDYSAPVREHHVELRLAPRRDEWQKVISHSITTEPDVILSNYFDFFGNRVDYFCVIPPHNRLITRMTAEVETRRSNPFDFTPIPPAEQKDWLRQALRATPALHDFVLYRSRVTPDSAKLVSEFDAPPPHCDAGRPLFDSLLDLMAWVPSVMTYQAGATEVHADLIDAMKAGAGVCQDFAHLFIAVARSWGIPARYVMGYLDPGMAREEEVSQATHAWAEVLVPGGGWLGFDATHNLLANDHYVAVAVGRDSFDAAPQRGSFKGDDPGLPPRVSLAMHQQ